ncbi:MAG: calcium/sodium antiporter [Verrucomicrobiales bacterium]|nr:calcium/sodium antiporter [Verrucomicrobiales bacterium]
MLADSLFVLLSLVLLIAGAEGLVRGSASIALKLGLTPLMVGLTVVAFGTSSPELVVSIKASLAGQGDISVGNVVGSNIFNIAVILGLTALICPVAVQWQLIKIDAPIMVGVSLLMLLLLGDGALSRAEGSLLFAGIVSYTILNVYLARRTTTPAVEAEFEEGVPKPTSHWWADLLFIAGGLALLVFGSDLLVEHAVSLARSLGVSEAVIGLTIIAAGTSMPELATSIVAALRKEPDIAIGNVIGSNIFNILSILGLCSLVAPIQSSGIRPFDYWAMIGCAVLLLPMLWTGRKIVRIEGAILLAAYGAYLYVLWPKAA